MTLDKAQLVLNRLPPIQAPGGPHYMPAKTSHTLIRHILHAGGKQRGPLLCVVVTTYNTAEYVQLTLTSILSNSYSNLDVIVVDDSSTDQTKSIIQYNEWMDDRVTGVFLPSNTLGGAGTPTNIGLDRCRGKYVMLVDGDDWVEPDFFAKMVARAEAGAHDVVVSNFDIFDQSLVREVPAYDNQWWATLRKGPGVGSQASASLQSIGHPWRAWYCSFVTMCSSV